ncbi:hypothetical protein PF005_g16490 [Phytophthora fragariae]|uniref:Secreted protein n=1 Tax=Phytophthora fragariae TaxID=53985 RepID=A0A6A3ELG1_9STRA|nr:hypothetical protein PF003_g35239 [Phytophthora fragariae]KAE8932120.1 hypothetical protein PF009_g17845 [Phytophthora fragariae]KAE8999808.1 hypothetical protein PF011_g14469 [Phytophthora fragariae]KAE9080788.1 hypothetical protein PF007_g22904 [Phytophthora fragariae]KAE9097298.1 hypothetical protein PF010_g16021 [Phytophthora fragariae]
MVLMLTCSLCLSFRALWTSSLRPRDLNRVCMPGHLRRHACNCIFSARRHAPRGFHSLGQASSCSGEPWTTSREDPRHSTSRGTGRFAIPLSANFSAARQPSSVANSRAFSDVGNSRGVGRRCDR